MGKTKIKPVEEVIIEEPTKEVESPVEENQPLDETQPKEEAKEKTTTKKATEKGEPKFKHGKKYQKASESISKTQTYPLAEAVSLAQKASYSKFSGTLEAHINTSTKNMRGLVNLPHLAGKKLTILAFGNGAKEAGADIVGTEETVAEIEKGKLNFDIVVTTPAWMPKLAKAAKILGPRGLMPNPKSGTITENLEKTITELKNGKTEYKTESNGQVIHMAIGKTDQPVEEVAANIKTLFNVLGKSKIKKITLSATMGLGVKVDLSSI